MRDLVQLALQPKTSKPSVERVGQRSGDSGFNDILQLKPGKGRTMAGKEIAGEDAPPSPAFRIKFASHGLGAGLPVSAAMPAEQFQHLPVADAETDEAGETGKDLAIGDEIATESELLPLDRAMPEEEAPEEEAVEPDVAENLAAMGPAVPPVQPAALAAAQAPREIGSRSQSKQTVNADSPDIIGESEPEAAKPTDRPALSQAPATARKALPKTADAPAFPAPLGAAAPETEDGADRSTPETAQKALPNTADAPARPSPFTLTAQATAQQGQSQPASRAEPAIELRNAPPAPGDENRQDMPRLAATVKVTESLGIPAPQVPSPAASVISAIASTPQWISFARTGAASVTASTHTAEPVKLLTIQLNPAELGAVTAKLRLAGDQLTIELQVDRAEAYDRLSTDRETILKAVRALGIEVDKVTIQQPQAQGSVNARSDNSAAFNAGERDADFSAPGDLGGRESGETGGRRGRDGQDEPSAPTAGASVGQPNKDQRGLYI